MGAVIDQTIDPNLGETRIARLSKLALSRGVIYTVISILVTVAVLSYLFSKVTLAEVLQRIRDAYLPAVAMFLVFSLGSSVFRCWRYLLLLRVSGYAPKKSSMFLVVLVRNLFADLLPARIGTLVYVAIVTTRLGVPFDAAIASWAFSFVFDLLAIVPLVLFCVWYAGAGTMISQKALILGSIGLGVLLLLVLALLPKLFELAARIIAGINTRLLPAKFKHWLVESLSATQREVLKARQHGIYGKLLLLSMLVRVGKYGGLYMFLYALLQPMGFGLSQLDPARVFLGICAAELSASLPISGIAGFGMYQGTWAVIFEILGFPARIAQVTSLSHHIFTQAYGYGLGIAAMLILLLPWFKVNTLSAPRRLELPGFRRFYGRLALTVMLISVTVIGIHRASGSPPVVKQFPADVPTSQELSDRLAFAREVPGRIIFDSNRSGTFGIYSVATDGSDLRVLADSPEHEMYPDPAPDGSKIIYASQLSTQRNTISDVWVVNVDGTDPRKIIENGSFPSFSKDGKKIYFQRERNGAFQFEISDGKITKLFPRKGDDFGDYEVVMPRLNSQGTELVFTTDKQGRWKVFHVDLKTRKQRRFAHGCEAGWLPGDQATVWVSTDNARERSGIYRYDLGTGKSSELIDRDAPWGHEYFPTFSSDGRFLLYGATRPGLHSHIDSDYQIFVLDLTKERLVRITFDGFNNRWPKLVPR